MHHRQLLLKLHTNQVRKGRVEGVSLGACSIASPDNLELLDYGSSEALVIGEDTSAPFRPLTLSHISLCPCHTVCCSRHQLPPPCALPPPVTLLTSLPDCTQHLFCPGIHPFARCLRCASIRHDH